MTLRYFVENEPMESAEKAVEKVIDNISPKLFDDYIDEVYDDIEIFGCTYCASRVLKEVDEINYTMCFNDWKNDLFDEVLSVVNALAPGEEDSYCSVTILCEDDEENCDTNEFEAILFL